MMDYNKAIDDLVSKYGLFIECDEKTKRMLFLNLIETREDFHRLFKLIDEMGGGTLPSSEGYKGLIQLNSWSWHLSDHLNAIFKILQEHDFNSGEDDSDDEAESSDVAK